MELYRALTYASIRLEPSSVPGTTPYTTDTAYSGTQVTGDVSRPARRVQREPPGHRRRREDLPDRHVHRLDDACGRPTGEEGDGGHSRPQ